MFHDGKLILYRYNESMFTDLKLYGTLNFYKSIHCHLIMWYAWFVQYCVNGYQVHLKFYNMSVVVDGRYAKRYECIL